MKKLNLSTLLVMAIVVFSSCSSSEGDDPILEQQAALQEEVFKQPLTVQRNANGYYSMGYQLSKGVASDIITNDATNTKEINLYASENESSRSYNESLAIGNNDSFSIDINNTINNNKSTLTIFDNDIKFNRTESNDKLKDYKITDNGDGSYDLDFTVKDNVSVDYIYDGDENVYEIHLNEISSASETNFLKTFRRDEGEVLKIEFIHNSGSTKSSRATESEGKPYIIIRE